MIISLPIFCNERQKLAQIQTICSLMHLGAIKGKLKTKNAYYTKLGANPIILFDMILCHIPIVNWRSNTIPSFELTPVKQKDSTYMKTGW